MSVTIDNSFGTTGDYPFNSGSFSFAVGSSTDLMVVIVCSTYDYQSPSSIDYNGLGLTKIFDQPSSGNSTGISIWTVNNPASGTHNLNINYSGNKSMMFAVFSLIQTGTTGVDATDGGFNTQDLPFTTSFANDLLIVGGAFLQSTSGSNLPGFGETSVINGQLVKDEFSNIANAFIGYKFVSAIGGTHTGYAFSGTQQGITTSIAAVAIAGTGNGTSNFLAFL